MVLRSVDQVKGWAIHSSRSLLPITATTRASPAMGDHDDHVD